MAGTFNFVVENGEDFDRVLTWGTDPNNPPSKGGPKVNLTNFTAALSVNGMTNFITTSPGANGQITLGGVDGTIRIYIPASVWNQFADTIVSFKLFVTAQNGSPSCPLKGNFTVVA